MGILAGTIVSVGILLMPYCTAQYSDHSHCETDSYAYAACPAYPEEYIDGTKGFQIMVTWNGIKKYACMKASLEISYRPWNLATIDLPFMELKSWSDSRRPECKFKMKKVGNYWVNIQQYNNGNKYLGRYT